MKNIIGTAVGATIDRRDGDSEIKGVILGYFTSGAEDDRQAGYPRRNQHRRCWNGEAREQIKTPD